MFRRLLFLFALLPLATAVALPAVADVPEPEIKVKTCKHKKRRGFFKAYDEEGVRVFKFKGPKSATFHIPDSIPVVLQSCKTYSNSDVCKKTLLMGFGFPFGQEDSFTGRLNCGSVPSPTYIEYIDLGMPGEPLAYLATDCKIDVKKNKNGKLRGRFSATMQGFDEEPPLVLQGCFYSKGF